MHPFSLGVKSADQEVKYDLQIFADRIEFCWIHLRGIPALENSLWAYDAHGIRIWLNALAIEKQPTEEITEDVKESVTIPLSFYPLCQLLCLRNFGKLMAPISCTYGQRHYYRRRERAGGKVESPFCHV